VAGLEAEVLPLLVVVDECERNGSGGEVDVVPPGAKLELNGGGALSMMLTLAF